MDRAADVVIDIALLSVAADTKSTEGSGFSS